MTDDTLIPDLVAALIITAGLFVMSLGTFDAVRQSDFSPAGIAKCKDRHQISMTEVLSCEEREHE